MSVSPNPAAAPVAVLCGSVTRSVAALNAAEQWYREQGYTVHKPVADSTKTPEEHAKRWFALIDWADVVVICIGEDGRVGTQTAREHYCALMKNKPVEFWPRAEERAS